MTQVGVQVPAEPSQLMMLRALCDTVALIADFALDEVADIRLALDEVVTWLILDAAPDANVDCRFVYDSRCMVVYISSVTRSEHALTDTNLCRQIVQRLTDTLYTAQEPFDRDHSGYPTSIAFSWLRRSARDRWRARGSEWTR
ncbi:anti-sigma factor [Nocardia tengchongensis]|uniref:Anti-sigma factor n=1 Tax=Nocardia tengchongensis TaxID=2055889 RepID=A0ABX8CGX1_9NOCA|nr:anti-sigma factor [Nocardia tengchongensis]QVI19198.1 anti-sigma factor [Nocardia tengchongensis]